QPHRLPSPHPACRGDRQDAFPDPPTHASPCLWVQASERWPRHAGLATLPRAQEHSAHRQVHRNGARPLQRLLEVTLFGPPATAVAVGVEPLCRFEQVTRGVPPRGEGSRINLRISRALPTGGRGRTYNFAISTKMAVLPSTNLV